VLIPAFAVGRSQEILYFLGKHYDDWQIDRWKIFLDSPLAIEASEIYWDFPHLFDEEASDSFREEDFMPSLPNLHFTRTGAESRVINRMKRGAIIIAGSGMCNGGRILQHFRRDIGRPETQIVFTGFQPDGTLGRRIIDGADTVRIYGDEFPVRATPCIPSVDSPHMATRKICCAGTTALPRPRRRADRGLSRSRRPGCRRGVSDDAAGTLRYRRSGCGQRRPGESRGFRSPERPLNSVRPKAGRH
jgi:hypothetical protein